MSILLLSITTFLAAQKAPVNFKELVHDFGEIKEADGPATHEFIFTNNSDKPINIIRVNASCGCTTPGWSKDPVLPGQTGYVKAQYDPKARPGYFNKSLTVMFDGAEPLNLQITGRVLPVNAPLVTEFPAKMGMLRLKSNSLNLGKVFINQQAIVKELELYNEAEQAIEIREIQNQTAYLKAEVNLKVIEPGSRASLKITYSPALKKAYGFQTDNILIISNDASMPVKNINVYAMLEEDFSNLSEADLKKAPVLDIDQTTYDFGKLKANAVANKNFVFTNNGASVLHIRDIQSNCTCVTASAEKKSLKPGESTSVQVSFSTEGRRANQPKVITVYSNDPRNPVQRININAYIEFN